MSEKRNPKLMRTQSIKLNSQADKQERLNEHNEYDRKVKEFKAWWEHVE